MQVVLILWCHLIISQALAADTSRKTLRIVESLALNFRPERLNMNVHYTSTRECRSSRCHVTSQSSEQRSLFTTIADMPLFRVPTTVLSAKTARNPTVPWTSTPQRTRIMNPPWTNHLEAVLQTPRLEAPPAMRSQHSTCKR